MDFLSCHSDLIRPSPKRQRITAFSAPAEKNAPAAEVVPPEPSVVAEDLPSAAELIAALDRNDRKKMRRKILRRQKLIEGIMRMWIHGSFCSLVLCIFAD